MKIRSVVFEFIADRQTRWRTLFSYITHLVTFFSKCGDPCLQNRIEENESCKTGFRLWYMNRNCMQYTEKQINLHDVPALVTK